MSDTLLLVGLGNPGGKYARHRHNVGFMAVDAVAEAHGFSPARSKFRAELREGWLEGPSGRVKAIALKPQTYMNVSGQSVGEAARFFQIPLSNIVVFHDELDLAPGKIRVKTGGGSAGHNGLRSLDAHLGPEYRRVRIGIGHPGDKAMVTPHVLGDFAKSDREWLDPLLSAIAKAAPLLAVDDARFTGAVAETLRPQTEKRLREEKPEERPAAAAETKAAPAPAPRRNPFAEALARLLPHRKSSE
jgi:PTH1 family peptidyl-tRNA hydrolase